jgi:hypothetical protein
MSSNRGGEDDMSSNRGGIREITWSGENTCYRRNRWLVASCSRHLGERQQRICPLQVIDRTIRPLATSADLLI